MTVALGLICADGVLVASDSMSSSGLTARRANKVFRWEHAPVVWTAAGSVYVIEEVAAELKAIDQQCAKGNTPEAAMVLGPNLEKLRVKLYSALHRVVKRCYESALPFGLNQAVQGSHPFLTDILILGYSTGTPFFLEFAHDGQMNWHADSYAVGSGGEYATVATALMQHYLEGERLSLDLGLQVAYRAIETTCEVSSQNVRLPVQLAVADKDGARILSDDDVEQVKTEVTGWKELERNTFRKPQEVGGEAEALPTLDA